MSIFKRTLRWTLNAFLWREQRRKLGAFVLNEACGDNDGEAVSNGEYALLRRVLSQPSQTSRVAFDVGANVGAWSGEYLRQAGAGDRVFAFEPSKSTFEELSGSLRADSRASPVNVALSDRDGEALLHLAGERSGTNSIERRNVGEHGASTSETIQMQTGDGFCARNGIERIDFMKIDTEGHELAVLKGFDRMLSEKRIGLLQFEYGGTWLDARIQLADAFAFLLPKGYAIAKIFPAGLKFYDAYDQRLDTFQYANFAAMPAEMKHAWGGME